MLISIFFNALSLSLSNLMLILVLMHCPLLTDQMAQIGGKGPFPVLHRLSSVVEESWGHPLPTTSPNMASVMSYSWSREGE